jgi:hypothetical protein
MQRRSVVPVAMGFHHDFDVLIERDEEEHQALDRKLPEFAPEHLGDIGLADAEQRGRFDLFQAAPFHERVNLEDKLRLDEVFLCIWQAEILKHVPAPSFVSFLAHTAFSFAICSASRNLCLINSMSRRGVSRPVFDFFWNV